MKYVADANAMPLSHLRNESKRGRHLRTRHYAILHVIGRADASHGAEGVLAPLPKQLALLGRFRDAELAGPTALTDLANLFSLLLHGFDETFEFDQQHGGGIERVTRVRSQFDHAQHLA